MTNELIDEIALNKVYTIKKSITETQEKVEQICQEIKALTLRRKTLNQEYKNLTIYLNEAKKQSSALKKLIWKSNDPEIVSLRNQLLLAVKLVKE